LQAPQKDRRSRAKGTVILFIPTKNLCFICLCREKYNDKIGGWVLQNTKMSICQKVIKIFVALKQRHKRYLKMTGIAFCRIAFFFNVSLIRPK
jgi:hypothetical protein